MDFRGLCVRWAFIDTMLYYDKSVDRYEDYQQEHTKNKSQHSPRL